MRLFSSPPISGHRPRLQWILSDVAPAHLRYILRASKGGLVKRLISTFILLLFSSTLFAQLEPRPLASQEELLKDKDAKLAANKKLVFDFWREVLEARHLDLAEKYMRPDYMQHNPNATTGI